MGNYSDPLALLKKEYGSISSEYQERMLGLKSLPKDEAVDTDPEDSGIQLEMDIINCRISK